MWDVQVEMPPKQVTVLLYFFKACHRRSLRFAAQDFNRMKPSKLLYQSTFHWEMYAEFNVAGSVISINHKCHKSGISLLISWILRVSHAIRLMDRPFQRTLGNCWGTTHRNRREVNMFCSPPIILVGGKTPLKNHGVRQLGWWHSIPNLFLLLVYSLLKSLFISLLTTTVTRNVHKQSRFVGIKHVLSPPTRSSRLDSHLFSGHIFTNVVELKFAKLFHAISHFHCYPPYT